MDKTKKAKYLKHWFVVEISSIHRHDGL